jgi:hypothetical protein
MAVGWVAIVGLDPVFFLFGRNWTNFWNLLQVLIFTVVKGHPENCTRHFPGYLCPDPSVNLFTVFMTIVLLLHAGLWARHGQSPASTQRNLKSIERNIYWGRLICGYILTNMHILIIHDYVYWCIFEAYSIKGWWNSCL